MWLVELNYNFECHWLIELSDNKLSDNKLSDNKLSDNKLSDNKLSDNKLSDNKPSDNNLRSELVENRSFLDNHNRGNCNSVILPLKFPLSFTYNHATNSSIHFSMRTPSSYLVTYDV